MMRGSPSGEEHDGAKVGVVVRRLLDALGWEIWANWGSYRVGVWTGPDEDLMSVRRCRSYGASQYWLSPAATTVARAIVRALVLRATGLRILSFVEIPKEDASIFDGPRHRISRREWLYTTDGSGYPRRTTWWMPWRARRWIRDENRRRSEFMRQVDRAKALLLLESVALPNGIIASLTDLERVVVEQLRADMGIPGPDWDFEPEVGVYAKALYKDSSRKAGEP